RDLVLEEAWSHNGKLILKFIEVDSMDEAERLRGAELCIPEQDRDPLPDGEFYYDDLKGMAVVDLETGARLGTVTGFTEGIGPGVVDVVSRGAECVGNRDPEEWQIPFANDICVDVDMERQQLRVRLPEGLRELNRP
nr:ribosome maturation factor RimM [Bryobacterales bacterium]